MKSALNMDEATKARFWAKVRKADGCWAWTASTNGKGYGHFVFLSDGRQVKLYAHRIAYELLRGKIQAGMEIDHLCRNRGCCNPEHLEPVTPTANKARTRRSTCGKGHPMDGPNLYIDAKGLRHCRSCRIRRSREWRERSGKI